MTKWIPVTERLPEPKEMGAFSRSEVIVQCDREDSEPWQVMKMGWLTFIGRDPNRPLWLEGDNKNGTPIENSAWHVTHWRPFPKFPAPIIREKVDA